MEYVGLHPINHKTQNTISYFLFLLENALGYMKKLGTIYLDYSSDEKVIETLVF